MESVIRSIRRITKDTSVLSPLSLCYPNIHLIVPLLLHLLSKILDSKAQSQKQPPKQSPKQASKQQPSLPFANSQYPCSSIGSNNSRTPAASNTALLRTSVSD